MVMGIPSTRTQATNFDMATNSDIFYLVLVRQHFNNNSAASNNADGSPERGGNKPKEEDGALVRVDCKSLLKKVKSMQRSGTEAIRTQIQPSKQKREITKEAAYKWNGASNPTIWNLSLGPLYR